MDNFEEGLSVGGVLRVLRGSGSFGFEKLSDREKGFEFLFGMTLMIVLVALLAAEAILATGFHETDELELLSLFSMRAGAFQIGGFSHDWLRVKRSKIVILLNGKRKAVLFFTSLVQFILFN